MSDTPLTLAELQERVNAACAERGYLPDAIKPDAFKYACAMGRLAGGTLPHVSIIWNGRCGIDLKTQRREMEYRAIQSALKICNGHRRNVAKRLGISSATLYTRLKEMGITVFLLCALGCAAPKSKPVLPPLPIAESLHARSGDVRAAAVVAPPKPAPVLALMWDKNDPRAEVKTEIYSTQDLKQWSFYGSTNGASYPIPAIERQQFFRVRNRLGDEVSEWNY